VFSPHFRYESRPRGLSRSGLPELSERGDLMDGHRHAGLAQFTPPFAEPMDSRSTLRNSRPPSPTGEARTPPNTRKHREIPRNS
jgi:hypothetical protein